MKILKQLAIFAIAPLILFACKPKDKIEFPEGIDVVDVEPGSGEGAKANDFVEVHYTGYLAENNEKFDSSLDRNRTFRFQLGTGAVIQGWDKGLLGMKEGGKRTITIAPEYGYGERGAGGVIPPNATLVFEVEMVKITPEPEPWDYKDSDLVTTDSGLQYLIRTEGEGESIEEGDLLEIYYAGFLEDGTLFDSTIRDSDPFLFQTGSGQAIPGIEEGVAGMKVGEERILVIPPDLGFGEEGVNEVIPPYSYLYFNIRVEGIR
jgi:peptidylprolyl isomerase